MDAINTEELSEPALQLAVRQAMAAAPSPVVDSLNAYAHKLQKQGNYYCAAIALKRALAIAPDNAQLLGNLGGVLWHFAHREDALDLLTRSVEAETNAGALVNRGLVLAALGRNTEAIADLDAAIAMEPENYWAQWNRALTKLKIGYWQEGFDEYECRFAYRGEPFYYKMPFPFWNGEDLNGKTLMIIEEQGIGDRILFSRYAYHIKKQYPDCKILYMAAPQMVNLLWYYKDIVEFVPDGAPWPKADFGIYQMTAARFIETRPSRVPKDPGLILQRIAASAKGVHLPEPRTPGIKVGISWTGNPDNITNYDRSIPLEFLLELAENPNVTLYSLQVGPGHDALARLDAGDLAYDLGPTAAKKGLVGTAMVMMHFDLNITVCTSIAHLGGVLGVPTWVLLCDDAYWVWGEGSKTPFYPSVELFRQPEPGDWRSVIDAVKDALAYFIDRKFSPI